jgi:hypothetical protein
MNVQTRRGRDAGITDDGSDTARRVRVASRPWAAAGGSRVDNARVWGRRERLQRLLPAVICGVLLGALFSAPRGVDPAAGLHDDRWWPCPQHVTKSVEAKKRFIACQDGRIEAPGSPDYIIGVGICESGPDLADRYDDDGHGGPFQQISRPKSTWRERFAANTFPSDGPLVNDVVDFRSNTIVSMRMAKADGTWEYDWACA